MIRRGEKRELNIGVNRRNSRRLKTLCLKNPWQNEKNEEPIIYQFPSAPATESNSVGAVGDHPGRGVRGATFLRPRAADIAGRLHRLGCQQTCDLAVVRRPGLSRNSPDQNSPRSSPPDRLPNPCQTARWTVFEMNCT